MVESVPEFESLLETLKATRGFDFTAYKRGTLMRRIEKRMHAVGIESYADYADYLELHPNEYTALFNTILINVTHFFRDAPVWEYIREQVLPRILEDNSPDAPIRVWCAGCASGEEAYTLAIVIAETMGVGAFRSRVKIYATDVDEDTLSVARHGVYSKSDLEDMPDALREKYFEPVADRFSFRKDLRRSIIFGRQDLLQDAPISRVDLLTSRNTLMYFNSESQEQVLERFYFALAEGGFVVLGKAETLLTHASGLVPFELKHRIFRKADRRARNQLLTLVQNNADPPNDASRVHLSEAAFDVDPVAQIIIDAAGNLALANASARQMFGLTARDVGRPLQDLEVSYRPVELRSLIDRTNSERRPVVVRDVAWVTPLNDSRTLDVHVLPLADEAEAALGVKFIFSDVTRYNELRGELERSKLDLDTAYEELQSSNEELETTNEELQSTVEELETTNEELQSTNEELETMNEELQSTNEELEATNQESRLRSDDLNQLNNFLQSILSVMHVGAAVVNRDLRIDLWNSVAEELWGVREDEVLGSELPRLDIGLPVDQIAVAIRQCFLEGGQQNEFEVDAVNRRGRKFRCKVTLLPSRLTGDHGWEMIVLMEEATRDAEAK